MTSRLPTVVGFVSATVTDLAGDAFPVFCWTREIGPDAPVSVFVQAVVNVVPLKFTACTVVSRVKTIVSPSRPVASYQSGHGIPLIAPVPLAGVWVTTAASLMRIALSVPALVPTSSWVPPAFGTGELSTSPRFQHDVDAPEPQGVVPLKSMPFAALSFQRLGWPAPPFDRLVTQTALLVVSTSGIEEMMSMF